MTFIIAGISWTFSPYNQCKLCEIKHQWGGKMSKLCDKHNNMRYRNVVEQHQICVLFSVTEFVVLVIVSSLYRADN